MFKPPFPAGQKPLFQWVIRVPSRVVRVHAAMLDHRRYGLLPDHSEREVSFNGEFYRYCMSMGGIAQE